MTAPNQGQQKPFSRALRTKNDAPTEVGLCPEDADLFRLLDATTDGILIHRDLRYVYANPAALHLLGRTRAEVVGHSPFDLVPPRFRLLLAERVMEVFAKKISMPEVEERLLHASGAEVPVEVIDIP